MMSRLTTTSAIAAAVALLSTPVAAPVAALAQTAQNSGKGWFVPPQQGAQPETAPRSVVRRTPAPQPQAEPAPEEAEQANAQPVLPVPPVPNVPEQAKAAAPPAPVMGVLSVPDLMARSTAAQEIDKVLGARRDSLSAAAQKEPANRREINQQIQQSKGLTQEQAQAKLRALQDRVARAQRQFRERNRIIQEAAQVAYGQVERTLVQVIKQVAQARGMNLVLNREQVALAMPAFDITQNVADVLNKVLPSVFIPADGEDPEKLAKSGKYPTTADIPAGSVGAPAPVITNASGVAPSGKH